MPYCKDVPADALLVQRALTGEAKAFTMLYERWQPRLSSWVYRKWFYSHDDVQDVVSDTFLRVHRHLHHYDQMKPFSNWLFGICSNLCKNNARDDARRRRTMADSSVLTDDIPFLDTPDPDTPETVHDRMALSQRVHRAINCLPDIHRELILTRLYGKRRSYEQMAEDFQLSVGTVKSRIYRARETLTALLADEYDTYIQRSA